MGKSDEFRDPSARGRSSRTTEMATERFFTVEEANHLLPWLKEVLEQTAPLQRQIDSLVGEVSDLTKKTRQNGGSSTEDALKQKRREIRDLTRQVNELLKEVADRGIVVRDPGRGLVDFPGLLEGREVCLCWLLGEPRVAFWHEVDAGFTGRQPLY